MSAVEYNEALLSIPSHTDLLTTPGSHGKVVSNSHRYTDDRYKKYVKIRPPKNRNIPDLNSRILMKLYSNVKVKT